MDEKAGGVCLETCGSLFSSSPRSLRLSFGNKDVEVQSLRNPVGKTEERTAAACTCRVTPSSAASAFVKLL